MKTNPKAVIQIIETPDREERFLGCLLGLAAGDALGTTVEFKPRGTFKPLTTMTGGGPFGLAPGQWTDDTSMALCLAASLTGRKTFDPTDQMERYSRWRDEGYFSSTGRCFDIGVTTNAALSRYQYSKNANAGSTDPASAGNGSIMRLAPIPMFYLPDFEAIEQYAAQSSLTTHGVPECVDACRLFGRIIGRALMGQSMEEVLFADASTFRGQERIVALARGDYRNKAAAQIRGTGYVVHSLEAALWCFLQGGDFEQAILMAANLGDDADTTAAVCGQVAGAYYGVRGIPADWLEKLALRETIADLAKQLCAGR